MCSQETIENSWSACECEPEAGEVFVLRVPSFEALVDLEMALEYYADEIGSWRGLTDKEMDSELNLRTMLFEVQAIREPITRQRKLQNDLKKVL